MPLSLLSTLAFRVTVPGTPFGSPLGAGDTAPSPACAREAAADARALQTVLCGNAQARSPPGKCFINETKSWRGLFSHASFCPSFLCSDRLRQVLPRRPSNGQVTHLSPAQRSSASESE